LNLQKTEDDSYAPPQNGVEIYDVKEVKSKDIALNGTAFNQFAKRT
jgi:hypothetical protein